MEQTTLAEQFRPLIAGRYTGQPATLWRQIELSWQDDSVLDVTEDSRVIDPVTRELSVPFCEAITEAIEARDHVRLLVLVDQAEEKGVPSELCRLTREAVRVQYPR